MTPLKGVDSQVYALAQGNILVGGAGASAGGSSVQVNQLNGGRITNGAVIERELPSQFGVGNTLNLQLNDEDFSMAQQIADTINRVRGYGSATALDARTIQVRVPSGNSSQVRFLADIQNMQVNVTPQDAKVVINSRTGSVVMNREVTLDSCAVAQGNLSVTVNRQANVSQIHRLVVDRLWLLHKRRSIYARAAVRCKAYVPAPASITWCARSMRWALRRWI